jgi:hypothetical protein
VNAVEYLQEELAKRLGPWMGATDAGKLIQKDQLYTPIILMPNQALEILVLVEMMNNERSAS